MKDKQSVNEQQIDVKVGAGSVCAAKLGQLTIAITVAEWQAVASGEAPAAMAPFAENGLR